MISVGSRDARKGPGLGFGGSAMGREMEDTELEEGEACFYQNNEDYDENIDPDTDLSYIDEKLQNVLGQFQKDFEGGVSAENLGAKFGGYGSFLPTYQRSPVYSHQKTPPKIQNYSSPRSPNNLQLEGGHYNSLVSSTAPHSVGRGPASTSSTSLPAVKASSASEPGKQEVSMPATRAEEIAPRPYSFNKKPTYTSDQKTLKVRLKVGSDNLPPRKNEELYCGLGLDNSPSSSLDDSPSESEGMSHEPPDDPFESPTSILQIMTSFPVHGGLLLSPLPDDLIRLMEKEKLPKEGRSRGGIGTSGLVNGFDTKKGDRKVFEEKKMESAERNDCSAESKSGNNKDARNGIGVSSRKEPDLDSLACEELVSTTLMLPILSNSYSTSGNTTKSREVNKSILKDKASSDEAEDKQMESIFIQEDGWVGKKKASSAGNGLGDGKENFINDISVHPHKEGHQKGEKTCDFVKYESNVNKGRKALNTEGMDSFKQNASMKDKSHEHSTRLLLEKEHRNGKKKKLKASRGAMAAMLPEESLATGSSKIIKNSNMGNHMSSNNAENTKSHKDIGKNTDTYRDFFGELEEDNLVDSVEIPFEDKPKDSNVFSKNEPAINGASKERPSGRKIDRPSTSETVLVTASSPRSGKGPVSDAAPPTGDHADNWVECVACREWRLLPSNVDPEQLPDNWLCSMQVWLPGMNRCGFTEEQTREAILALRQSQSHLSNPGAFSSEATLANFRHPDHGLRTPGSGKKKHGLKVTSSAMNKDGPIQLPNYTKKNMQASMKSRSLNDVNNSPDFQQLSKSNDFSMEKEKHKHKERNKEFEPHNFGGDTKTLKMKRGVSEQDSSRASKKHKLDGKNLIDDGWASDHGRAVGKVGPSSSNGFPTSGKNFTKCSARSSSKDSKVDVKNSEIRENVKKRKTKELQNGSFPGTGRQFHDTEEFSENEYKKEKKPRISRSDGKESSANKGNSRTDKKSRHKRTPLLGQDLGINPSQQSLDGGIDPLKRDFGPMQSSFAATSSSSKVSGSHKTKSSFQEVKGSPVESVSSSPMRILNPDKFTSGRDLSVKDEFQDVGPFAVSSPKRSSDGDNLGEGDQTRAGRKDKTYNVANLGSLESFAHNSQDRDFNHVSGSKARRQVAHSPDVAIHHSVNGSLADLGQNTQYSSKPLAPEHSGEEKHNESHHSANGSCPRKSGKGSTSRMEKNRSFKSDFDLVKVKNSDAVIELQNCSPSIDVKSRDGKNKLQEKLGVKSDVIDEKVDSKRGVRGTLSGESSKRESQLSIGGRDGPALEADAICRKDALSTPKQNLIQDCNDERSSKREMSVPLPPSGGLPSDTLNRCPRPGAGSNKGNGSYQVDASEGDNAVKEQKQIRKADNQSRSQQINSRHPAKGGHRTRDLDAPSPARKDSSSHAAANAIKEAKDLKHLADRLKNSGSSHERRGLYFQSALKFLHGASLWESSYNEASKASEMVHSTKIYCDTAKLCEFCAHEYEKSKDMAGAALAYKCMEVAYMKVIYSSSGNASRDRHELQTALQMVPLGESPSSSASDVDNLNNPTTVEKVALPKGVSSPQVATNHVIAAQNRSNYVRLLSFVQDVNYAMEASRKSRVAFAAANISMGESKYKEVIDSIKKALDFNFQDVEGLLRLVRLAMEGIGR